MTMPTTFAANAPWTDAVLAARLFALSPQSLGGVVVRASPGPVRDAWMALALSTVPLGLPVRRLPLNTSSDRLLGGLDLAATLETGRRVLDKGLLARADGGIVVIPMAERCGTDMAMHVTAALDTGRILIERDGLQANMPAKFGVIALDEGMPDEERPPAAVLDRLAIHIDLSTCGAADLAASATSFVEFADTRRRSGSTSLTDSEIARTLCVTALALGIGSLRAPLFAVTVARLHAALFGRTTVSEADVALAARLVLAPRATAVPDHVGKQPDQSEPQASQNERPPSPQGEDVETRIDAPPGASLEDRIVAAALASLPEGVLQSLTARTAALSRSAPDGKAGAARRSSRRGRVLGVRAASRDSKARLNVLATLRAAAPWQRLRRVEMQRDNLDRYTQSVIRIRRTDFRVNTYKHRASSTIVFAVDASGSSALHRLAEAKGAVELLLAECYARRDKVALISFRGTGAEILLAPSRSLARAKRSLAGLPGGGGTPLVAGIETARIAADCARRKGDTPLIVLMTDGRANVTRTGHGGRAEAAAQAIAAARDIRTAGISALLIDTSPQPQPLAARIANEMGGRYVPLPQADASAISIAIERERVSSRGK